MSRKIDYWKGPACGVDNCKSKWYYEENGETFCRKGHRQEGIRTQQDEDDFGTRGRKTRIRKETQEKVSRIHRGHSAVELYLQAYQLILWKQCHALINIIGLPAELESVVKDLWALRLQLLKGKTVAVLNEDTVFSSQPQTETEIESNGEEVGKVYNVEAKAMPTLIETLGLCYLGMVLLRSPIGMGDLHRWAVREDIPFIRAVRFVPAAMKQKLPAEYLKSLDTTSPLEPDHLRKAIHNLSLFYRHHFELVFPPLNTPLLLYKQMRDLAVPSKLHEALLSHTQIKPAPDEATVTLHPITLHLANLLSISFAFPSPGCRQRTSSLPELQLISLLIIATKLYHPFDGLPRHVPSLADPAALSIDWPSWVQAQKAHNRSNADENHLQRGTEINVTEVDAMNMSGEQLDEYMDYYERTFIDPDRVEQKLSKELLDMFPTGRLDGSEPASYSYQEQFAKEQEAVEETLDAVIGSMRLRNVISKENEEPVRRIGSFYKRYRRAEDLDGYAKVFHEKVAETVGVKLETLVLAVGQMERLLIKWREAKVKEGLEGGEEEDTAGGEDEAGGEESENVEMMDESE